MVEIPTTTIITYEIQTAFIETISDHNFWHVLPTRIITYEMHFLVSGIHLVCRSVKHQQTIIDILKTIIFLRHLKTHVKR